MEFRESRLLIYGQCFLQFVWQYAPHLHRRTFLGSKLRRKGNPAIRLPFVLQYASHLYGSTTPFVRQYFWKNTGVGVTGTFLNLRRLRSSWWSRSSARIEAAKVGRQRGWARGNPSRQTFKPLLCLFPSNIQSIEEQVCETIFQVVPMRLQEDRVVNFEIIERVCNLSRREGNPRPILPLYCNPPQPHTEPRNGKSGKCYFETKKWTFGGPPSDPFK